METLAEIDTDTSQVCLETYSEFCGKLILGLIFRYWGMSKTKKVTKALLSTAGTKWSSTFLERSMLKLL